MKTKQTRPKLYHEQTSRLLQRLVDLGGVYYEAIQLHKQDAKNMESCGRLDDARISKLRVKFCQDAHNALTQTVSDFMSGETALRKAKKK